jgi:hypothetical protein
VWAVDAAEAGLVLEHQADGSAFPRLLLDDIPNDGGQFF